MKHIYCFINFGSKITFWAFVICLNLLLSGCSRNSNRFKTRIQKALFNPTSKGNLPEKPVYSPVQRVITDTTTTSCLSAPDGHLGGTEQTQCYTGRWRDRQWQEYTSTSLYSGGKNTFYTKLCLLVFFISVLSERASFPPKNVERFYFFMNLLLIWTPVRFTTGLVFLRTTV